MNRLPKSGEFYRHFKGNLYQIIAIAKHSETREKMVVYQALYGDYGMYVRPLEMFVSEVDHEKYPEVIQKYRFEQINPQDFVKEVPTQMEKESCKSIPKKEEKPDQSNQIDPNLLAFLEADTYTEKIEVLQSIKKTLTEDILQTIAISLDFTLGDGDFADQYDSVLFYLETHARYEGNRLR